MSQSEDSSCKRKRKGDQRFLPAYRITRGAEFERAYRRRLTAGDHCLLVFVFPNGLPHARLGLSVLRKVGGAVVRNRWKRCIREAFRLLRDQLPAGVDLVVIPRADAVVETAAIQESLIRLCAKGGEEDMKRTDMRCKRLHAILQVVLHSPACVLIGMVRVYQYTLSPLVGRHCRFRPLVQRYFIEAVRKYGALGGTWRGIWRICRCNPWNPGGYDPP